MLSKLKWTLNRKEVGKYMNAESENREASEDCRWHNRTEVWEAFLDIPLKGLDTVLMKPFVPSSIHSFSTQQQSTGFDFVGE